MWGWRHVIPYPRSPFGLGQACVLSLRGGNSRQASSTFATDLSRHKGCNICARELGWGGKFSRRTFVSDNLASAGGARFKTEWMPSRRNPHKAHTHTHHDHAPVLTLLFAPSCHYNTQERRPLGFASFRPPSNTVIILRPSQSHASS